MASVFWDADSLVANPGDVSALLKELSPFDLLPITVIEPSITGTVTRMAFQTLNGETRIIAAGKRLDVVKFPTDSTGTNMGTLDDFASNSEKYFETFLRYFKRKGNRLALIQEGVFSKLEEREIQAICNRLFKLPDIYAHYPPFEWNWRNICKVSRTFNGKTEHINTITHLSRARIMLGSANSTGITFSGTELDAIKFEFDLNTPSDNPDLRFDVSEVRSFLKNAVLWHFELSESISKFITEQINA
jgi:hypothetical protein